MFQRFLVALSLAFLATLSVPATADLVFSAPPRESQSGGADSYAPLAQYLSKVTGQKVDYRYSDNWLSYQKEMQKGTYDLVFDGPHFVGWRMAKLGHVPLVKFPGNLSFVVIVKKDQSRYNSIRQLAGRTICAHAPPNLATLTVLYEFKNPARQPVIIDTQGFPAAYKGVVSGKCVAAILQAKLAAELDKETHATRVIYQSEPLPNQALSAGPPGFRRRCSRRYTARCSRTRAGPPPAPCWSVSRRRNSCPPAARSISASACCCRMCTVLTGNNGRERHAVVIRGGSKKLRRVSRDRVVSPRHDLSGAEVYSLSLLNSGPSHVACHLYGK